MKQGQLLNGNVLVIMIVLGEAFATILNNDQNVQNTISEEERRGSPTNNISGDKQTRGIHSVSATHKHHRYIVPSEYDSQLAGTAHAFGGSVSNTGGHDFATHGSGLSGNEGATHAHLHQHHYGHSGYGSLSGYGGGFGSGTGGGGGGGYSSHGYGHSTSGIGSTGLAGSGHNHAGHGGSFGVGGHGGGGFHNALALKSLLIPLAGIALLGAAAALTTSPVLLQLGVVNGRRRRRSAPSLIRYYNNNHYPPNPYVRPDDAE